MSARADRPKPSQSIAKSGRSVVAARWSKRGRISKLDAAALKL
jgi:hypothetical protein